MTQVDFYHLTRAPVEVVLPKLLEKILEGGGRALVVAQDQGMLARLDNQLWRGERAGFLPHGLAGDGHEDEQPVLLSSEARALNDARFLLIVDGHWVESSDSFERIFYLFDESVIDEARAKWRALSQSKRYWKQDEEGRWRQGP